MMLDIVKVANEIAKTIITAILAILILYMVQVPGTILNSKKTSEDILRDRAKLLIDIALIEDESQRRIAYEALKYVYKDNSDKLFDGISVLLDVDDKLNVIRNSIGSLTEFDEDDCLTLEGRLVVLKNQSADAESQLVAVNDSEGNVKTIQTNLLDHINELRLKITKLEENLDKRCS